MIFVAGVARFNVLLILVSRIVFILLTLVFINNSITIIASFLTFDRFEVWVNIINLCIIRTV